MLEITNTLIMSNTQANSWSVREILLQYKLESSFSYLKEFQSNERCFDPFVIHSTIEVEVKGSGC